MREPGLSGVPALCLSLFTEGPHSPSPTPMSARASLLGYDNHARCLPKRKGRPVVANEKKYLIGPDEGAHLHILDITHEVTAEDLGSAFTIIEAGLPPDAMIPPHTHTREDECNFVLEDELTFDIGGEIVVAQVGSFVVKPRGVYHAFCNTGAGPQSAPGNTFPG